VFWTGGLESLDNFSPEILPVLSKAARCRYYAGNTAFSLHTQTQRKFLIEEKV